MYLEGKVKKFQFSKHYPRGPNNVALLSGLQALEMRENKHANRYKRIHINIHIRSLDTITRQLIFLFISNYVSLGLIEHIKKLTRVKTPHQ